MVSHQHRPQDRGPPHSFVFLRAPKRPLADNPVDFGIDPGEFEGRAEAELEFSSSSMTFPKQNRVKKSWSLFPDMDRKEEEVQRHHKNLVQAWKRNAWVIWPQARWLETWELTLLVVLTYTFIITPFQVAFLLQTPVPIFVLNRFVDLVLIVDMFLCCFMAVEKNHSSRKPTWVSDLSKIRWLYFRSYFFLDMIGLLASVAEIIEYAGVGVEFAGAAKISRFARLFRLVRVLRMARLVAVFGELKGKVEQLLGSREIGFIATELVKWLIQILMAAHVVACAWGYAGLYSEQSGDSISWILAVEQTKGFSIDRDSDPMTLYLLALYWAFTTLVTVGYGDIVPWTIPEHVVCLLLMVIGSVSWTLLMASACSVVAAMDAERLDYGLALESMVSICRDYDLPQELRYRLRRFLAKSRRMKVIARQQEVMKTMSPQLQGEVARYATEKFLRKVYYLRQVEDPLMTLLAELLVLHIIPPNEWVVPPEQAPFVATVRGVRNGFHFVERLESSKSVIKTERLESTSSVKAPTAKVGDLTAGGAASAHLFAADSVAVITTGILDGNYVAPLTIMEGGIAIRHVVCMAGSYWHQDMILLSPYLRDKQVAQALVFCSAYFLRHDEMFSALFAGNFVSSQKAIKWAAFKMAMLRMLQRIGVLMNLPEGPLTQAEACRRAFSEQDRMIQQINSFSDKLDNSAALPDPVVAQGGAASLTASMASIKELLEKMNLRMEEVVQRQDVLDQRLSVVDEHVLQLRSESGASVSHLCPG